MKDNFLKSWKTTLLGLAILIMYGYSVISSGKQAVRHNSDYNSSIDTYVSFFWIYSLVKMVTNSHSMSLTQEGIDAPDPKKEEK